MQFARLFIIVGCICFFLTSSVHLHPGGLDSKSCHADRETGQYHCHQKKIPENQVKLSVRVVSVTDGDTTKAIINGKQERIRLYGINVQKADRITVKLLQI